MSLEVDSASRVQGLRAVAHPVRLRILSLLTGAEMSAAEIARELGISQANASYHVRTLAGAGLISVVGVERVRGGRAKKYRYLVDAEDSKTKTASTPQDQVVLVEAVTAELRRRVLKRQDDQPAEFTDAELWVDPAIWREVVRQVHEAAMMLHEAAKTPHVEGAIPVSMVAFMFAMAEDTR